MLQRLSIEWMKLKNYRTFWILSILYLVCIVGINFIVYRVQQTIYTAKEAKGMAQMVIGTPPYSFPNVWHMTSFVSSYLLFIPGLLIIISVSNEYSFKTHRQNIIDGWTRRQFITNKLLLALIAAIISTIMVAITAFVFGLMGEENFSTEKIHFLFYFFIQALAFILIALLLAVLIRRGGLAIGIYFLYPLIEKFISGILDYKVYNSGKFLPIASSTKLMPLPIFENIQNQILKAPNYTLQLIIALAFIGLYIFFINRKFETDDL